MQVYNTRSFRPDSQLVDHNGVLDRLGVFFVTPRIASSKAYRQWTVIFVTNERTNGQSNAREDAIRSNLL